MNFNPGNHEFVLIGWQGSCQQNTLGNGISADLPLIFCMTMRQAMPSMSLKNMRMRMPKNIEMVGMVNSGEFIDEISLQPLMHLREQLSTP